MAATPVHGQHFIRDGRGPELKRVHYRSNGSLLVATDYLNPDEEELRHLLFIKPQVFMFTPEEVVGNDVPWGTGNLGSAGIVCLGRSPWLESFAPANLGKCQHFRIAFYDEYLDVICERIEAKRDGYVDA